MQVGAFAGGGAARIDVDDAHAALGPRHLDALVEDRVAPSRIRADQNHEIGKLQVVVALRHDVGAEGAAVAGDGRGHAQARVGIDVRRADEALGQLVGDIIVLGQQLAGEIESDGVGAMRPADALDARGDMIDRLVPSRAPSADFRMQQPGFEAQRLAECGALRAQSAEVGGVVRVAGDSRAAFAIGSGEHAAADAAVGAGGAHGARRLALGRHQ